MDGKTVDDWRTVYIGCRTVGLVFVLDDGGNDCFDFVKLEAMELKIKSLTAALERVATERFPMPTPCRETYLRNIAKKALEI